MTAGRHAVLDMLRVPGLQRLLAMRFAGQFGDGLFQTALFSAVFFDPTRATSAGEAAAGFATLLLPYSVVGPFAGVLLDRWSRQRVLLVANLLRAGLIGMFSEVRAPSTLGTFPARLHLRLRPVARCGCSPVADQPCRAGAAAGRCSRAGLARRR